MNYPIDRIKDTATPTKDSYLGALQNLRVPLCAAYKNNPDFFTPPGSITSMPGVRDIIAHQLDNMCSDQPLPPPRTQPFTGGQCDCVAYRYTLTVVAQTGATPVVTQGTLLGPVRPLRIVKVQDSPVSYSAFLDATTCSNGKPNGIQSSSVAGFGAGGSATISNITRVDTAADTCGNPDRVEPNLPSIQPPSLTFNVNLPDIRANANILIPVIVFRPTAIFNLNLSPNLSVSVPIKMGNVNFELRDNSIIRINPAITNIDNSEINTNINNAITTINNNTNGIVTTINNNTNTKTSSVITTVNSNTDTRITDSITTINNNTNTKTSGVITTVNNNTNTSIANSTNAINSHTDIVLSPISTNLLSVINALALIQASIDNNVSISLAIKLLLELCPCPEPVDSPLVSDEPKPEEPKTNKNAKIQAVSIVITQRPRKQLWGGGGNAPDKLIAGWFAWKVRDGGWSVQQPINYEKSTFIRPAQSDEYAYTLTNGAKGFAIEHVVS